MDYNTRMCNQELLIIAEELQKDANAHYWLAKQGFMPKINLRAYDAKSKLADEYKYLAKYMEG